MNHRKARTYPHTIVTLLAVLTVTAAAVVSIIAETGRQEPTQQPEQAVNTAYLSDTDGGHSEPAPSAETVVQAPPEPTPTYQSEIYSLDFDGEDAEILLKIAMAEAESESVEGKALVMLTVLNRVWDEQFPDSIEEVVFQKNQFSPTVPGGRYWTTTPDAGCQEALDLVMGGWDGSQGALYFESTGKEGWHSQNLEFLFEFGGHKFYR